MNVELEPGRELWAVASGQLKPWRRASRDAVKYMGGLDGFVGVHIIPGDGRTLWYFDTLNNAKGARNLMRAKGIPVGVNISRWIVGADGVPEIDPDWREA